MVCDPLPDGVDSLVPREEIGTVTAFPTQDYTRENPDRVFPLPYQYWRYVLLGRRNGTRQ